MQERYNNKFVKFNEADSHAGFYDFLFFALASSKLMSIQKWNKRISDLAYQSLIVWKVLFRKNSMDSRVQRF
jgi:hypothetical protein